MQVVRAEGLEPSRAFAQRIFVPAAAFATPATWQGLRSGLSLRPVPALCRRGLGAARLVSTPSPVLAFGLGAWLGIAFEGFPEFGQFYTASFPAGTQSLKSVASTSSATPA